MKKKILVSTTFVATAAFQLGCASQSAVEADFGNAVREVTMNQTYDIGATLDSQPDAVVGADPYQLENVINAHRERSTQSRQTGSGTFIGSGNRK